MRDFHDQKDLFKAIHQLIDLDPHENLGDVDVPVGMTYTVDIFLWFMARRGYVLRKSTARLDFDDIDETIKYARKDRDAGSARILTQMMSPITGLDDNNDTNKDSMP